MYFDVVGLGNPSRQKIISMMIGEKDKNIHLALTHEPCKGDEEGWYANDIAVCNSDDEVIGFLSSSDSQIVAPLLAQNPNLKVKMSNIEEDDKGFFNYDVQLAYAKSINMSFSCLRLKDESNEQAALRHLQYYAKDEISISSPQYPSQKPQESVTTKNISNTQLKFDNLQKLENDKKFSNFFIGAAIIFLFFIVIGMLN